MTIVDRYILRLFLKSLLVCFCSFTGLYIVFDAFGNLEEFLQYKDQVGMRVFLDYYGPRVLTFFDQTSCLLSLIAAIFVLTWMQRTNELTAIQAAGISRSRIIKPLLITTVAISLFGVVNREVLIPNCRDGLARNAQNWLGENSRKMTPVFDYKTQVLISGKATLARDRKIEFPGFQLPGDHEGYGDTLTAEAAHYVPARDGRPAGYRLDRVVQPSNLRALPSIRRGDQPIVLSPSEYDWLAADQCFLVSDITFDQIANGKQVQQFSSSWELLLAMRNPSLDYGTGARVMLHGRLLQPFLDIGLVLLGLPLVTSRQSRNIFVAAGSCLLVVALFLITNLILQSLGSYELIRPAALAAWLPAIIFLPIAYVAYRRGWD